MAHFPANVFHEITCMRFTDAVKINALDQTENTIPSSHKIPRCHF